jgi:protein-disulfide isomerase
MSSRQEHKRARLRVLGGVAAAAVVVVIALVVIGGGGKGAEPAAHEGQLAGVGANARLLRGIPQRGQTLGRADAPVTLVQYVDLQCPYCAQFDTQALPEVIRRYVRTGKVRLEQRTLAILGADSGTAARWAAAAARQNRLFEFSGVFFANQGQENTGYVTPRFLSRVTHAVGLGPAAVSAASSSPAAQRLVSDAQRGADALGVDSTPSFALGRTGRRLRALPVSSLTASAVTGPIDRLLEGGG